MDRRSFLKMIGLTAGALATATLLPVGISHPDFDPSKSYGDYVTATEEIPAKHWMHTLDKQIEKHIPLDCRDRIEYREYKPNQREDPLLQYRCYGWKYVPKGA